MIVSHLRRFVYVRTVKTASSSLEMALAKWCGPDDILTPIHPREEAWKVERGYPGPQNNRLPLRAWTPGIALLRLRGRTPVYWNHMTAAEIVRAVGRQLWKEYATFTVERNPFDRIVSQYFWRTRNQQPRPPFGEYLRSLRPDEISNRHRYSLDGEIAVDRVLRFEDLEAELADFADDFGWPRLDQLPAAKTSSRPPNASYRSVIGPTDRSLIEAVCGPEIERFKYEF